MTKESIPEKKKQLSEKLLMEAPCAICVARADEAYSVLFANDAFFGMFVDISEQDLQSGGLFGMLKQSELETVAQIKNEVEHVAANREAKATIEIRWDNHNKPRWMAMCIKRVDWEETMLICTFEDITARKEAEGKTRILEKEFQIVVRHSDKMVFRYDIEKRTAYLSPETAARYGKTKIENFPERIMENGYIKSDSRVIFLKLIQSISNGVRVSGSAVLQMNFKQKKDEYDWYRIYYSIVFNQDSAPSQAIISLQNVSEQYERELAYKRWEQTYAAIPQSKMMYLEFDLTRNRFEHSKGSLAGPLPDMVGPTMETVLEYFIEKWVYADDRAKLTNYTARAKLLTDYFRNAQIGDIEYRHRRDDGSYGWVRVSVQMLPDPYSSNIRAFLLFRDIDLRKREELNIRDRLCSDPLTGVFNRKAFIEKAEEICAGLKEKSLCAFVMVDVDHFKQVNDRFGHAYGDRVLVRIAETLHSSVRASDLVARMGGDEFLVLLQDIGSKEMLLAKLTYLREQIFQRVSSDIVISCSFGAACCPVDGTTFDELYFKSDVALYAAKEDGRNCARIYEGGMRLHNYFSDADEM